MSFQPTEYKLLSFDIYGTLIDWESGIFEALLPLLSKLPESSLHHPARNSSSQNRSFILTEYTNLELATQKEHPTLSYPKILATAYERIAKKLQIPFTAEESEAFGLTIGTWSAFPDTVAAMQELGRHYKLVVLSNVDKTSFARTLAGPLKGVRFDGIYTAEDIGSYKPDLRNFQYMVEHAEKDFGVKKHEILKVAQSLLHDHRSAKKFGLRPSVWIKRSGDDASMGGKFDDCKDDVQLAATFETLGELAAEVQKAFSNAH